MTHRPVPLEALNQPGPTFVLEVLDGERARDLGHLAQVSSGEQGVKETLLGAVGPLARAQRAHGNRDEEA